MPEEGFHLQSWRGSSVRIRTRQTGVHLKRTLAFVTFVAIALSTFCTLAAAANAKFGPSNPFYAPSTLPFHAPPFDKIKDEDYQPAIEAGMAEAARRDPGDCRQSGGTDV